MTPDSLAASTDSTTSESTAELCDWVRVDRSSAVTCCARSSRRPMSMKYQPGSRTMFSLARPDSASMPESTAAWVEDSVMPPSPEVSDSSATARSVAPSTIQVSPDSWSRTERAASRSPYSDCATVPTSVASSIRSRIRGSGSAPAENPRVPDTSVTASSSTGTQPAPRCSGRKRKSSTRSRATISSRVRSSVRSAYRPSQNMSSSTRGDEVESGRSGCTSGPSYSQTRPSRRSGTSARPERTQTSLATLLRPRPAVVSSPSCTRPSEPGIAT